MAGNAEKKRIEKTVRIPDDRRLHGVLLLFDGDHRVAESVIGGRSPTRDPAKQSLCIGCGSVCCFAGVALILPDLCPASDAKRSAPKKAVLFFAGGAAF